jgi:hypothetical protein
MKYVAILGNNQGTRISAPDLEGLADMVKVLCKALSGVDETLPDAFFSNVSIEEEPKRIGQLDIARDGDGFSVRYRPYPLS